MTWGSGLDPRGDDRLAAIPAAGAIRVHPMRRHASWPGGRPPLRREVHRPARSPCPRTSGRRSTACSPCSSTWTPAIVPRRRPVSAARSPSPSAWRGRPGRLRHLRVRLARRPPSWRAASARRRRESGDRGTAGSIPLRARDGERHGPAAAAVDAVLVEDPRTCGSRRGDSPNSAYRGRTRASGTMSPRVGGVMALPHHPRMPSPRQS